MVYELEICVDDKGDEAAILTGNRGAKEVIMKKDVEVFADFGSPSLGPPKITTTRDVLACVENLLRGKGEAVQQFLLQQDTEIFFWVLTGQNR